jgi:predicted ATP-grasp superfamily ATP-dependent carboligase
VLRERCDSPLLEEAAAKIVRELKWTGVGQLDFIAKADMTEPYLLEMNPRWWGALNLAVVNGFDFPLGLVTMLLDGQPVSSAFCEGVPRRKSLWIVGELMACRAELMQGKLYSPFSSLWRILFPGRDCAYDDFSWRDPLPLLFEVVHYFERFLRAHCEALQGSTAPHPSPPQPGEG